MKILIIHYHLKPGGVTRIIQSQVEALLKKGISDIEIIAGEAPQQEIFKHNKININTFHDLNYFTEDIPSKEIIENRINELKSFIKNKITPNDIVHFHNKNLGKNPIATITAAQLASEGYNILNHAHDFAEDRPANMELYRNMVEDVMGLKLNEILYPKTPNYQFAVLNTFDKNRLIGYGIPEEKIHLLPNPVSFPSIDSLLTKESCKNEICETLNLDKNKLLFTYPVRVIGRKNIGEFILLASLFSKNASFLNTLPPQNPIEVVEYEKWKDFCTEHNIEVHFEVGMKVDFTKLLVASDACITTSIKEGFGMVYLEPWLMGTPSMGRNLEMITVDLKQMGIEFPLIYDEIKVEFNGKKQDFKELSINEQREYLKILVLNKAEKQKILENNPIIEQLLKPVTSELVRKNRNTIKEKFSLEKYGELLDGAYRAIID